uniref:Uncharacterized protein n=1 Tax=Cacopsylla melanoneura TaxID=428564 RepID=A0A8D8M4L4_9HEMI
MINKMHNNNNIILETESIITKYINMKNSCLNKTKTSTKRNLFGRPNKKLTDKLFYENQLSCQKIVCDFLNQFELVDEKENQSMDESGDCFNKDLDLTSSSCSSDFDKCSYSTSENSSNNSLCSQENCSFLNNNNNLVKINNEFSNKCDAIRNLINSSSSNNKQTLITDFMKSKKNPQNFLQVSRKSTPLSSLHTEDQSFDVRT